MSAHSIRRKNKTSLLFQLVIHVGVSGEAKQLTLEQQAHNDGYVRTDIRGELPDFYRCHESADPCVQSSLSMQDVSTAVVNSKCGVDAVWSLDPGRYAWIDIHKIIILNIIRLFNKTIKIIINKRVTINFYNNLSNLLKSL